ncbi:MAG: hypothetical protein LW821_00300 [Flammeovirgaceae bacterium]|jgi:hypothetical protein|nr:hypothetical protein [Flammeovirgaceae bacterium]
MLLLVSQAMIDKKYYLILIFNLIALPSSAQVAVEVLTGNKQTHYINYLEKDFGEEAKWNYFNLNRFTVDYESKSNNSVSIEGQLTYNINTWFGFSAGGGLYGEVFVPTAGVSISLDKPDKSIFMQVYPTLGWANRKLMPSVLGLLGYAPTFNSRWGLSTQVIFSVDASESVQLIRVGVDYQSTLQFGIGADLQQSFEDGRANYNVGPFIRFTF